VAGRHRIGAGVIGPSGIGRVHIDALRRIGVDVVAIAASTPQRGASLARELDVPVACESATALVQRSDVHTVHICTPNALHSEQVQLALAAAKHVVCEKPLATSISEAETLLKQADARGVVHAVAYNYRFYPMVRAMRSAVSDGQLGRVHLVRGAYLVDEVLSLENTESWMLDPLRMGPSLSLADIGIHWWDLAEQVSGQAIESVMCTRQVVRGPNASGEDSAAILLRLSDGAIASAVISSAAPGHGNTIELEMIGTKASAWWAQENPDRLWFAPLRKPVEVRERDADRENGHLLRTLQVARGQPQGYLDAFRDLMASVYDTIRASNPTLPYATFADGVRGVRVLEALLQSADTGVWVSI
jgi:predicted dehydrogenase